MIRTFDDIVQDYVARFREPREREARWFATQPTLKDAIEHAAMAVSPSGKRLSHQRRIPKVVLRSWAGSLLRCRSRLQNSKTFDQWHDLMAEVGIDQHGIGALTVYDTATRIGAFLGREPKRVYLHAGTRDGAKALGLHRRNWLSPRDLPMPLRRLSPGEIEDCLCIYKRAIAAIATRTNRVPVMKGC